VEHTAAAGPLVYVQLHHDYYQLYIDGVAAVRKVV